MATIVSIAEEWAYSSFQDYIGLRKGTLCNIDKTIELLNISAMDLQSETKTEISEEKIKKIY